MHIIFEIIAICNKKSIENVLLNIYNNMELKKELRVTIKLGISKNKRLRYFNILIRIHT